MIPGVRRLDNGNWEAFIETSTGEILWTSTEPYKKKLDAQEAVLVQMKVRRERASA